MNRKQARDLIFPVYGEVLPREHRWELSAGIRRVCPFWCAATCCGILPIRGKNMARDLIRLCEPSTLRIRVRCFDEYLFRCLAGEVLNVQEHLIRIGPFSSSKVEPSRALLAEVVCFAGARSRDEVAAKAAQELRVLGVQGELRIGESVPVRTWDGVVSGYEVGVVGLSERDSFVLQDNGLGNFRVLGCGVFEPWSGRGLSRV